MPVHRLNRAILVIAVAVVHLAGIALILILWPGEQRFVEWPESLVVISLPEPAPRPETKTPAGVARRPTQPAASTAQPQSAAIESTAPVALPPVDWQQELEGAAKAKADATPWQSVVPKTKPKPRKEFGWDRKHTNRIERGALPAVHIGDHCVLIAFLIPACAFGKIPVRGDLFDGMDDPDQPSSVPEAPPSDMRHSDESPQ